MTSPLGKLLGDPNTPPACKVVSEDVAVHWYPPAATVGDPCICGKIRKKEATR